MTSFVLVHGAFGGSYGFRKVRRLLAGEGHDVLTPSLTGIGERSHLATSDIDLELHIQDLVNAVFYEDVQDMVLLGFSYGGMVVTGAIDQIGDRISQLVYLDAFVPGDGQSVADLLGVDGQAMLDSADDGFVSPIARDLGDAEANNWMQARRVPQPVKTLIKPVSLSKPVEAWDFGLTYIKATGDPDESDDSPFWLAHGRATASPEWRTHEINCNHMIPELGPDELVTILTSL